MDEISKWVFDLEAGIQADNEPAVDDSLDAVLRGQAVELWWRGDTLWLVSDEEEAKRLGQPRGQVYTAAEARRIATITDPDLVSEVQRYKREFNGTVREIVTGLEGGEA